MIEAEYSFTLPVPSHEAFAVLSNPAMEPEWQSACVGSRLLDGPAHVGGRYEITFQMVGRRMTFVVAITAYEPSTRSEFSVLEGPFHYSGSYVYGERTDGGTDVLWTFRVEPGDYFGVTPLSLVRKLLVNQVKQDSRKLAERLRNTAGVLPAQGDR